MRLAIMQPYFLPHLGYFQLIRSVDAFIVYDNIKYTKKGWVNRNRFLLNGSDAQFTLPLKSATNQLDVVERHISEAFDPNKLLAQWGGAYSKAPYFAAVQPLIERLVAIDDRNLFGFIENSIIQICRHFRIETPIIRSSTIGIDHRLKGQEKVLAFCRELGCLTYVNAIGGAELYDEAEFSANGIALRFLRSRPFDYAQFGAAFVPDLSVIDVMMFNSSARIAEALRAFDLVLPAEASSPKENS